MIIESLPAFKFQEIWVLGKKISPRCSDSKSFEYLGIQDLRFDYLGSDTGVPLPYAEQYWGPEASQPINCQEAFPQLLWCGQVFDIVLLWLQILWDLTKTSGNPNITLTMDWGSSVLF